MRGKENKRNNANSTCGNHNNTYNTCNSKY